MPPNAHALLGASSASRWLSCTRAPRLEALFPDKSSPYAEEGTQAHDLCEKLLRGETPKGKTNLEMEQSASFYASEVLAALAEAQRETEDAELMVETRIDFSRWVPEGFGTADAIIVSDNRLDVFDFKYGKGVKVDAEGNPQLRLYALGAIALLGDLYGFQTVGIHIIQPRMDNVSQETLTREELLAWGEEIKPIAQLAYDGKGEFAPSEKACRFCRAKAVCKARFLHSITPLQEASDVLDNNQIAAVLSVAKSAKAFFDDVIEYANERAKKGDIPRGYKLVKGKTPPAKWADEKAVMATLPKEYLKLPSPSQVRDLVGKEVFAEVYKEHTTTPEAGVVLVPESDKRQPVGVLTASEIEADLKEI